MLLLTAILAHLLLGPLWIPWMAGVGTLALFGLPQLSAEWIMRALGGIEIAPARAPGLYQMVAGLTERAELPRIPRIYWMPRSVVNAFAVGNASNPAVAVTEGMLRTLEPREIRAVLAHEIAHIRKGDMRAMLLAELFARVTGTFGSVGMLLLFLNLPLLLFGAAQVPWLGIAILIGSPILNQLLQLALSRTRERSADLEAVRLTGDPRALASALHKIETLQGGLFEELVFRHRHGATANWLRTHPPTQERITTLLALEDEPDEPHSPSDAQFFSFLDGVPKRRSRSHYVR